MNDFEQACRPVIFEADDPEFSYWTKGSSFLIANSENYYWVTAAHVLENAKADVDSLRIFPSDNSKRSLPFNEKYRIKTNSTDNEDYEDIMMLRIDLGEFDDSGDMPLIAQDIDKGFLDAECLKKSDKLLIIGYPSESNFIEYENGIIKNTRSVISAVYDSKSFSDHCHKLTFVSSIKLESFDGLSGSPVYYLKNANLNGESLTYPMLVGMLLRGTASSGIAHFVSSRVISRMVHLVKENA